MRAFLIFLTASEPPKIKFVKTWASLRFAKTKGLGWGPSSICSRLEALISCNFGAFLRFKKNWEASIRNVGPNGPYKKYAIEKHSTLERPKSAKKAPDYYSNSEYGSSYEIYDDNPYSIFLQNGVQ